MPYPHIEAALDKLPDQYRRLKSPGKYYAEGGLPLAIYYHGMDTSILTMSLIHLVSILDDAFEKYIQTNAYGSSSKLCQRIELLNKHGLLRNPSRLHIIRKLRNECAHNPNTFIRREEFDGYYDDTRTELRHLGIVA